MQHRFILLFLCIGGLLVSCLPAGTVTGPGGTPVTIRYENRTYDPLVKDVNLYPATGQEYESIMPAVVPVAAPYPMVLTFDVLGNDYETFQARLIHCQANWTPSGLNNLEFLRDVNETRVENFSFSADTRTPYLHYRVPLPRVTLPGNYLVVVYRDGYPDDVILSRRFCVFSQQMGIINPTVTRPPDVSRRNTHQQVSFDVSTGNLQVRNPSQQLKVVVRQNQRDDRMLTGLVPSFVKEFERVIEYRQFDGSNELPGGNEFRFFDLRLMRAAGQQVDRITVGNNSVQAELTPAKPMSTQAYTQPLNPDYNGQYWVSPFGDGNRYNTAEYVNTLFTLDLPAPLAAAPSIKGAFNNWEGEPLVWNASIKQYQALLFLKQGWYNYFIDYNQTGKPDYSLEGSFFETENLYEIFVYFRDFNDRADRLVGYYSWVHQGF